MTVNLAEEFASENYNITRDDFIKLSHNVFGKNSKSLTTALNAFDEIQNDLVQYEKYISETSD